MTSHAHAPPPNPIAPWAEIVPGAPPMTADDLLTLPDDGSIYEVVDGVLVRMAGSGDLATTTAMSCDTVVIRRLLQRYKVFHTLIVPKEPSYPFGSLMREGRT